MEESGHDRGEQEMGEVCSCWSSTYPPSGISVHSGKLCEFSQYGATEGQNVKFVILLFSMVIIYFIKYIKLAGSAWFLPIKKHFCVLGSSSTTVGQIAFILNLFLNPHQSFQKYLYRKLKCFN